MQESTTYFRGRPLAFFIAGLAMLVALTILVPTPERWKHTIGMALIAITIGPWALSTFFRHHIGPYLVWCGAAIGIMGIVEAVFR